MKFYELPIGSRFEYQGEEYSKETPLVARNKDNGQKKFMARSALVTVPENTSIEQATEISDQTLTAETVRDAFEDFYNRCLDNMNQLTLEQEQSNRMRLDLKKAREHFLHSLSLEQ